MKDGPPRLHAGEVRAPGKLLPKLWEVVGFHGTFALAGGIPSMQSPTSRRGAVPWGCGTGWTPCLRLCGGGAGGVGLCQSRRGSWPEGPQGGCWMRAPRRCPRGLTLLISCERERESWREIFLSANLITIKIPIKSSYP